VAALDPTALMEEDSERTGHAERVMASYEAWFGRGPEIAMLALLSLFDRPAEPDVLRALTRDPAAGSLSRELPSFETRAWARVVARLREARLLAPVLPNDPSLDTHPLIRSYFARKLRSEDPESWRAGHSAIYEHLKKAAPEFPETLSDLMPLFHAVIHGCRAGMYYDAFHEVYQRRILHGDEHFSWKQLGTMSLDLAVLAGFFDGSWDNPVDSLNVSDISEIQSQVGLYLRALGRLDEAVAPMRDSIMPVIRTKDWINAAQRAANYSELELVRGELTEALRWAERSVEFADRTADGFRQLSLRARVGDALHQIGRIQESLAIFAEAERRQQVRQPQYPVLYSFQVLRRFSCRQVGKRSGHRPLG
jgi:tetratricopeptide (TPR) repeat protein